MAGLQSQDPRLGRAALAAAIALFAIAHPCVALAQAMGEYGRAGTQIHTSSKAPVPRVPKAAPAGSPTTEGAHLIQAKHTGEPSRESHTQGPPIWSEAWFTNHALVRGQVVAMVQAITASMIGESYPLPRGGGFRCTQPSGAGGQGDGPAWAMRCTGSDVGGQRENDFNVITPGTAPVLERVRWIVVAPASSHTEAWRGFYKELTDSLTRALGPASWSADHMSARWDSNVAETTARLHGVPTHPESLEVTCLSDRLAEPRRSAAP